MGLYWYLTDFCINAANLAGLTYAEFTFVMFVVAFPVTLALLFLVNVVKLGLWFVRR